MHAYFVGCGTQVLYTVLGLVSLLHLWWRTPESFANIVIVAIFSSMAVLLALGGHVIRAQSWATIKMYAVLMFLGAGTQLAFSIVFLLGSFTLDETISNIVRRTLPPIHGAAKTWHWLCASECVSGVMIWER